MAMTLLIKAHPSSRGFTHRIAAAYQNAKQQIGDEVEVLDLYSEENRQDYLNFENIKEIPEDPSVFRMQEKITKANELVFVFPIWWYGEPAILKNFLDKNFAANFSYRYINGRPIGLLKGKTARVFVTGDGPILYHWLLLHPMRQIWWLARLRFCGVKMNSFVVFGSMFKSNEAKRKKMLARVSKIAKK